MRGAVRVLHCQVMFCMALIGNVLFCFSFVFVFVLFLFLPVLFCSWLVLFCLHFVLSMVCFVIVLFWLRSATAAGPAAPMMTELPDVVDQTGSAADARRVYWTRKATPLVVILTRFLAGRRDRRDWFDRERFD